MLMLWCVAISAHYDCRMYWGHGAVYTASHWAALFGIVVGRCAPWQMLVFSLQLVVLWDTMPTPDNHWFFSGFISALYLLTLAPAYWRAGGYMSAADWQRWYESTMPIVRCMVILLYFFAVFHKLNWHYIDPDKSCGMHFFRRAAQSRWFLPLDPDPPRWLAHVIDYGILALEAAIPLFLMLRRTWWLGIICGISFHLSTAVFMRHFPTIMIGLYLCFVPSQVARAYLARIDGTIQRWTGGRLGLPGVMLLQALWLSAWALHMAWIILSFSAKKTAVGTGYVLMLRIWASLMSLGFVCTLLGAFRARAYRQHARAPLRSRLWWAYLLPLLLFINGFSPFMGLKSATSIAMWSNLVTAGGVSNHLFIEQGALKIFPYMDDLVEIRSTDVEGWHTRFVQRKRLVPYVMLNRWMARRAVSGIPTQLEFVRAGQLYSYERADLDPELTRAQPLWLRKLVFVKAYEPSLSGRCTW